MHFRAEDQVLLLKQHLCVIVYNFWLHMCTHTFFVLHALLNERLDLSENLIGWLVPAITYWLQLTAVNWLGLGVGDWLGLGVGDWLRLGVGDWLRLGVGDWLGVTAVVIIIFEMCLYSTMYSGQTEASLKTPYIVGLVTSSTTES